MPPEKRTLRHIVNELIAHPFFPLLFIAEAIKTAVTGGPLLEFTILAIVATLIWVFSDSITLEVDTESIL